MARGPLDRFFVKVYCLMCMLFVLVAACMDVLTLNLFKFQEALGDWLEPLIKELEDERHG